MQKFASITYYNFDLKGQIEKTRIRYILVFRDVNCTDLLDIFNPEGYSVSKNSECWQIIQNRIALKV